MSELRISVEEKNKGIKVIKCTGTIDTGTYIELQNALEELLVEKNYKIIVDLAGVDFMSSAGWGTFTGSVQRARTGFGDIRLAGMRDKVKSVFELIEINLILKAYKTVGEAVKSFE